MTDVRNSRPDAVEGIAKAVCPKCDHDNSAVKHPSYSRLLHALGFRQRVPYCDSIEGEYASGFASEIGCGCKHPYHQAIA